MAAEYIRINPDNLRKQELDPVIETLRNGGVIIYPTDTVYGLGCAINQKKALNRIAKLKNLKLENANFALIFHDLSHLSNFTKPMSNSLFRMIKKGLPGPFTFILEANNNVPKVFNQKKKRDVGIRIPEHPIPIEIVRLLGEPLVTTSVIDEDEILEYTTDPAMIYENFKDQVDLIIDAGYGNNIASTILDCTGDEVEVIREGLGDVNDLY